LKRIALCVLCFFIIQIPLPINASEENIERLRQCLRREKRYYPTKSDPLIMAFCIKSVRDSLGMPSNISGKSCLLWHESEKNRSLLTKEIANQEGLTYSQARTMLDAVMSVECF